MMKLYDAMILRVRDLTKGLPVRAYAYEEKKAWPENQDFEMIFQRDVAFELGGGKGISANLTCVTADPAVFAGPQGPAVADGIPAGPQGADALFERQGPTLDQVLVYGPDLQEIQGEVNYARICEVLVRDDFAGPESDVLKLLQDIEFEKFHVYGKGFMMRTSGQSAREQVRVSKKALKDGITFERMGDTFISHYKKSPSVLAVRVSFITAEAFEVGRLSEEAAKAVEIRNSLSKIQKGLPTECSVCDIREICNEVEGLRELHFGKKGASGDNTKDRAAKMVRL